MDKNGTRGTQTNISYLAFTADIIKNCWDAHPPLFLGLAAVSAALCAMQAGELFAMRRLFDEAALYLNGGAAFSDAVAAAVPLAVLLILSPFVNVLEYLGQGYFWRRGSGYLLARYHERVQNVPLIDFEKPGALDRMKKALLGGEAAPSAGRTAVQIVFHFVPYLIFTALFLVSVKPSLIAALAIIFITVFTAQTLKVKTARRFENENAAKRRLVEYLQNCITGREFIKETRTLGAEAFFMRRRADAVLDLNAAAMKAEWKMARTEILIWSVNILGYACILAMLVRSVADGSISAGAFAAVFYSVERVNGMMNKIVEYCGEFFAEMGAASFTCEFLGAKDGVKNGDALQKDTDICLTDVSFSYPGQAEGAKAVDGVTLKIAKGETVAVVGDNGAGKTTLAKLIAGLYTPDTGDVTYGGKNIAGYANKPRYSRVSTVFQDYARYALTAEENIRLSDTDAPEPAGPAADAAGFGYARLPGGLGAKLTREFGGAELSGGEWQRLAIARGLYRAHDVIVLDEPTAAIDPLKESHIFRLFGELSREKTAVLITHRLGSAKIADRIIMMENGRVIETGTHEELAAAGGRYASMYAEQAKIFDE